MAACWQTSCCRSTAWPCWWRGRQATLATLAGAGVRCLAVCPYAASAAQNLSAACRRQHQQGQAVQGARLGARVHLRGALAAAGHPEGAAGPPAQPAACRRACGQGVGWFDVSGEALASYGRAHSRSEVCRWLPDCLAGQQHVCHVADKAAALAKKGILYKELAHIAGHSLLTAQQTCMLSILPSVCAKHASLACLPYAWLAAAQQGQLLPLSLFPAAGLGATRSPVTSSVSSVGARARRSSSCRAASAL